MNKEIIKCKEQIEKYQQKIRDIQNNCKHIDFRKEESYSDGGYDYYASTRTTYICNDCGFL